LLRNGRTYSGRRGFPTDFPVVGWVIVGHPLGQRRGFPTDFPVVGSVAARHVELL